MYIYILWYNCTPSQFPSAEGPDECSHVDLLILHRWQAGIFYLWFFWRLIYLYVNIYIYIYTYMIWHSSSYLELRQRQSTATLQCNWLKVKHANWFRDCNATRRLQLKYMKQLHYCVIIKKTIYFIYIMNLLPVLPPPSFVLPYPLGSRTQFGCFIESKRLHSHTHWTHGTCNICIYIYVYIYIYYVVCSVVMYSIIF